MGRAIIQRQTTYCVALDPQQCRERGKKQNEICCPDTGDTLNCLKTKEHGGLSPRGNAADLLARPHSTLFQGFSSLQLALATVQGPQVPQGGVHRWAGQKTSKKKIYIKRLMKVQYYFFLQNTMCLELEITI